MNATTQAATPSGAQVGTRYSTDRTAGPGLTRPTMITLPEFKALIDRCDTDFEVAREFHYHFEQINGTHHEILEALKYADERHMSLGQSERLVA